MNVLRILGVITLLTMSIAPAMIVFDILLYYRDNPVSWGFAAIGVGTMLLCWCVAAIVWKMDP